jgi:hypothetical protein
VIVLCLTTPHTSHQPRYGWRMAHDEGDTMLSGRPAVGPPNGIFPLCSLEQQEAFTPSPGSALQSHRWPTEDAARHVRVRAARPSRGTPPCGPLTPYACVCSRLGRSRLAPPARPTGSPALVPRGPGPAPRRSHGGSAGTHLISPTDRWPRHPLR